MRARQKILPRRDLERRSAELQAAGHLVVLTNGCFDLLHVGHVRYLEAARALGDVLIVGVNSDASTRKLKGPARPLVPEEERAEVLAALSAVDLVVVFAEDTAEVLVQEAQPQIYVKGGDYSANPGSTRFPAEGHVALRYGGEVRCLPFVEGHSTTKLAQTLGLDGQ